PALPPLPARPPVPPAMPPTPVPDPTVQSARQVDQGAPFCAPMSHASPLFTVPLPHTVCHPRSRNSASSILMSCTGSLAATGSIMRSGRARRSQCDSVEPDRTGFDANRYVRPCASAPTFCRLSAESCTFVDDDAPARRVASLPVMDRTGIPTGNCARYDGSVWIVNGGSLVSSINKRALAPASSALCAIWIPAQISSDRTIAPDTEASKSHDSDGAAMTSRPDACLLAR